MRSRLRGLVALALIATQLSPIAAVLSQGSTPAIDVEALAPDKVGECLPANFTVRLENSGDGNATKVVVRVTIPGGVSYVSGTGRVNGTPAEPTVSGADLVWNVSDLGFDPIGPGEKLAVELNLSAGCSSSESADITATITYEDEGGNSYVSSDVSDPFQVLRPALVVEKSPTTQEAEVGDVVQWTLRVKNTGFVRAVNVTLVDELGSSLGYLGATPSPDGFLPDGRAYWTNISLAVGETFEVTLRATVDGCEGLVDNASAYVTCSGQCHSDWALGSIALKPRTPRIRMAGHSVSPSLVTPCAESKVEVTVENAGDGEARSLNVTLRLPSGLNYVSGTGSPQPDVSGNELTFHLGDLAAGGSRVVSFNVTADCGASGSGTVVFFPLYKDQCDHVWRPSVDSFQVPMASPSISVEKNGPHEALNATTSNYTLTVTVHGSDACPDPRMKVTDRLPDILTLVSAEPQPNSTAGRVITWDLRAQNITINLTTRRSDGASCGDWGENSVDAELNCCASCSPSSSDSHSIRITCSNQTDCFIVRSEANASSVEACSPLEYTTNVTFNVDGINSTLSNMTFSHCAAETGNLEETYLGPTTVTLPNGTQVTLDPYLHTSTCIYWNLSELNFVVNSGDVLEISYPMRVRCSAEGYIHDRMGLSLNATASDGTSLDCEGEERWAVYVEVRRPHLQISESHPPYTTVCEREERRVRVSGATASSPGYNLTVTSEVPSGLEFLGPSVVEFDNGTVVTNVDPIVQGDLLIWNSTNVPQLSKVDTGFTISYNMTPCCSVRPGYVYRSTLDYSDKCEALGICEPQCTCVWHETYTSGGQPILRANLVIYKTPERIYAESQMVEWRIWLYNSGNGTANNVTVVDSLGAGLRCNASTAPAGWSTRVSADGRTVTFTNGTLGPGDKVNFTLRAKMVACSGLTDHVNASWGCCSESCQVVEDSSDVVVPDGELYITDDLEPNPVNLCEGANVTAVVKNVGAVDVYNVTVNYTLPPCFYYNSSALATAFNSTYSAPISPAQVDPELRWVVWDLSGTPFSTLDREETVNITFGAVASCPCDDGGGHSTMRVTYDKPCAEQAAEIRTSGSTNYELRKPDLQVEAATRVCGENGDEIVWDVTVVNRGDTTARNVGVTIELPSATSYVSATPTPDSVTGRVLEWRPTSEGGSLDDIPPNGSQAFSITVRVVDCKSRAYIHVRVRDGCEGCVYEDEWYNSTSYLHSTPYRISVQIRDDTAEACEQATWRFRLRNSDPCLPLYVPSGRLIVNDTLATGVQAVTPLEDNTVVRFHDSSEGTDTYLPVYPYMVAPPPGVTMYVWVEGLPGGGIQWYIINDTWRLDPRDYFEVRYNVTSPDCSLVRADHTIQTDGVEDSCGKDKDRTRSRTDTVLVPVLQVTKEPKTQYADINQTVSWTIRVTNVGNATAPNVTVVDRLNSRFEYVDATPPPDRTEGIAGSYTELTWTNITLGPGENFTFDLRAKLVKCPPPNATDNVTAYWGCGPACSDPVSAEAIVLACGLPSPIDKNPRRFEVCGNETITITVHNSGATMYGISFNETLPFGLEPIDILPDGNVSANISVSGGPSYTNVPSNFTEVQAGSHRTIIWTLEDVTVPMGADVYLRFRVHANCSLTSTREVVNFTYWDACNHSYTNVTVFSTSDLRPDLSNSEKVVVSPAGRVDRWEEVVWDLIVRNSGDGSVYFLNLTDSLGEGLEFLGANVTPTSVSDGVIRWNLSLVQDPLEPGESMAIRVRANATGCPTRYTDTASFRWSCDGVICAGNEVQSEVSVDRARAGIDVKNGFDGELERCTDERVNFTARNTGDGTAYGFNSSMPVRLTYRFPTSACASYVSGSANVTLPNGTVLHMDPGVSAVGGTVELLWELTGVEVELGESIRVEFLLSVGCCSVPGGTFEASGSWYGACGEVLTDSDDVGPLEVLIPDISVSKEPPQQRQDWGDLAEWTIVVSNNGNGTARDVNVTDTLSDMEYVYDNRSDVRVSSSPNRVEWRVPSLGPGERFVVLLRANVTGCWIMEDNVEASWGCGGSDCESETDSAEVRLLYPNVSISLIPYTGHCPVSPEPGDLVNYTVRLESLPDTGTAYNLTYWVDLPEFMDYVWSEGGSYDPVLNRITWTLDSMGPGQTVDRNFTATVRALTPDRTRADVNATLTYHDSCGRTANPETGAEYFDNDSCGVVVVRSPVLDITKEFIPNQTTECSKVVVNVTFWNRGLGHMYNVSIVDDLPEGLRYVPNTTIVVNGSTGEIISTSDPTISGNRLTWDLGLTLNPGEGIRMNFTVRAACGTGGCVNWVTGYGEDGAGGRNSSTAHANLSVSYAVLRLSKSIGASVVPQGSTVKVYLMTTNRGNTTAWNLTFRDVLPVGMSYVSGSTRIGGAPAPDPVRRGRELIWRTTHSLDPGERLTLEFEAEVTGLGYMTNRGEVNWTCSCGPARDSDVILAVPPPSPPPPTPPPPSPPPPSPPPPSPPPPTPPENRTQPRPVIHIEKVADPDVARRGQVVRFHITVCNLGNASTEVIHVVDLLPEGLQPMGQTDWTVGPLDPGECVNLTLDARVTVIEGDLINVAKADGSNTTTVVYVRPTYVPAIGVTKTCPDEVRSGEQARIVVTVVNRGNGTFTGELVDLLPEGWVLSPESVEVEGRAEVRVEAGRLVLNLTLDPGETVRIIYTVTVNDEGCNRVTVAGEEVECCVSIVPATLSTMLLILAFLPVRSRPVVVDRESLKRLILSLGEERISKRWKIHISRRTASALLTDPAVGGSVERLISTGVLKVQDMTSEAEMARLVRRLARRLGVDRDEAESLALAMAMNARALISSSAILREAGAEISLDVRTPKEFIEEMISTGTLTEREWILALRKAG